jgi:hypothetical protein
MSFRRFLCAGRLSVSLVASGENGAGSPAISATSGEGKNGSGHKKAASVGRGSKSIETPAGQFFP